MEEWAEFDNGIVERAVQQWRDRLRECIKAEGGHFEYRIKAEGGHFEYQMQ